MTSNFIPNAYICYMYSEKNKPEKEQAILEQLLEWLNAAIHLLKLTMKIPHHRFLHWFWLGTHGFWLEAVKIKNSEELRKELYMVYCILVN